ncbi:MAG: hypothetical protein AAFN78_05640 [Pseudomonadota bacterium]
MAASDASSDAQAGKDDAEMAAAEGESFAANDDDGDEIVCRRERMTGSNIAKRVCRKASDIEARAEADQAVMRQRGSIRSGGATINGN